MQDLVQRKLDTLECARDCVRLGANHSTVSLMTGLPTKEIQRLFFASEDALTHRLPHSAEWVFDRRTSYRMHVALVVVIVAELLDKGFTPNWAMVHGYRLYRDSVARIRSKVAMPNFNRAFCFVRWTFGLWGGEKLLSLNVCEHGHRFVDHHAGSGVQALSCPLCKLSLARVDSRARQNLEGFALPGAELFPDGIPQRRVRKRADVNEPMLGVSIGQDPAVCGPLADRAAEGSAQPPAAVRASDSGTDEAKKARPPRRRASPSAQPALAAAA